MSVGRRIFYNTAAQTIGKALAVVVGLLTICLLTRHLGEEGFGQYATVIAFQGLFVVFADFGLYMYVVREISLPMGDLPQGGKPSRNYQILSNALGMRLVIATVSLLIGASLAWFFPYERAVKEAMLLAVLAFLPISLNQVMVGVFQKHLIQHLLTLSETVGRVVNLGLVYLFTLQGRPLAFFVFALAGANIAIFLSSYWIARRYEQFDFGFDFVFWRKILAASWPLIFAIVLNLLYFRTDIIILSWFYPEVVVGVYSLPYKILEGLLAFPAMFVGLVMPFLSMSAFKEWGKFRNYLQRAFDALLLMGVLVNVVLWFFAQEIIDLLKGPSGYADSPALLQILSLAAGAISLGTLFGYAVVAVDRQKTMIKGYLLGAVVGLILYFALIPPFGYWGAAWGTVITEVIVGGYAYLLVRNTSGQKISWRIFWPAGAAAVLMAAFFAVVHLPWMLEVIGGFLIYALGLVVFGAAPKGFVQEIFFLK